MTPLQHFTPETSWQRLIRLQKEFGTAESVFEARVAIEGCDLPLKLLRYPHIIAVEKCNKRRARGSNPLIPCLRQSSTLL